MNLIVGAHGVGKTTLLNEVAKVRKDYFVTDAFARPIREVTRRYPHIEFDNEFNQDLNNELMLWATDNYLKFDKVLSSRSLVDSIVYTKLFFPNKDISHIENKVKYMTKYIDYIFYIPIEFSIESDGIRPRDIGLQEKCDKLLLSTLSNLLLKSVRLITISGSVEERLERILKYL